MCVDLLYKIIILLGFWRQDYNNITVFTLVRNERRFHRRESRVTRVFSCSHLRVKKPRGADARKKRQQQSRWVGRRQKTILLCVQRYTRDVTPTWTTKLLTVLLYYGSRVHNVRVAVALRVHETVAYRVIQQARSSIPLNLI